MTVEKNVRLDSAPPAAEGQISSEAMAREKNGPFAGCDTPFTTLCHSLNLNLNRLINYYIRADVLFWFGFKMDCQVASDTPVKPNDSPTEEDHPMRGAAWLTATSTNTRAVRASDADQSAGRGGEWNLPWPHHPWWRGHMSVHTSWSQFSCSSELPWQQTYSQCWEQWQKSKAFL